MNGKSNNEKGSTWATIIEAVQTPLNFFTLIVLTVEGILGIIASLIQGPERTYLVVTMIALIPLSQLIVALMAIYRPEALRGLRPTEDTTSTKISLSPEPPRVVEDERNGEIYLVEEDQFFHIPDKPTFSYLAEYRGFRAADVEEMTPDDRGKLLPRKTLPKIEPHCEKYKATDPPTLIVHLAKWGAKDFMGDVTDEVKDKLEFSPEKNKWSLVANTHNLPDTYKYEEKWLMIAYSFDKGVKIKTVLEGETLSLP